MYITKKTWINGLFLVISLGINFLGALGFINGLSQKEISDKYLTLITPSPFTFSIWSIIYTLLLISIVVMIVKKDDVYYKNVVNEITILFRLSSILNAAWIVVFSFELVEISVVFILGLNITLALLCIKLKNIQVGIRFLLPLTFGLYTGWVLVAGVVNIASALVKIEWDGFGMADETWAIIILAIATILAFIFLVRTKNAAIPLPIAWAYYGINQFLVSNKNIVGDFKLLQTTSLIGIVILIGMAAIRLYQNHFALLPENSYE